MGTCWPRPTCGAPEPRLGIGASRAIRRQRWTGTTSPRGSQAWLNRGPEALLPGIEASGVASYHLSGWYARVGMEQLLWFSNMQRSSSAGRHRIVMGPWPGGGIANAGDAEREVWATETLRFMDF